jgi:hypothetical protein
MPSGSAPFDRSRSRAVVRPTDRQAERGGAQRRCGICPHMYDKDQDSQVQKIKTYSRASDGPVSDQRRAMLLAHHCQCPEDPTAKATLHIDTPAALVRAYLGRANVWKDTRTSPALHEPAARPRHGGGQAPPTDSPKLQRQRTGAELRPLVIQSSPARARRPSISLRLPHPPPTEPHTTRVPDELAGPPARW